MSNFLKNFQRDLKKVNVERTQISKKTVWYQKPKKESSRNDKKAIEIFGNTKKHIKEKEEHDAGDKKQSKRCS